MIELLERTTVLLFAIFLQLVFNTIIVFVILQEIKKRGKG